MLTIPPKAYSWSDSFNIGKGRIAKGYYETIIPESGDGAVAGGDSGGIIARADDLNNIIGIHEGEHPSLRKGRMISSSTIIDVIERELNYGKK